MTLQQMLKQVSDAQNAAAREAQLAQGDLTGTDIRLMLQMANGGPQLTPGTPEYEALYRTERDAYDERHDANKNKAVAGLSSAIIGGAAMGSGGGAEAVGDAGIAGGSGVDAMTVPAVEGASVPTAGADWWTEYGLTPQDVGVAGNGGGDWWTQYGLTAKDVGMEGAATGAASGSGFSLKSIAAATGIPEEVLAGAGRALPALLGAVGSKKQAGALQSVADRYETYGGPSRGRYEASMAPGFDPMSIPGYEGALDSASKSVLAKLSANGGNPFGNPGGLIDAQKQIVSGTALPAIQEYQRLNAGTGFGTTLTAAGGFDRDAIGAGTNVYNAVGAGANDVLNPPQTLAQQIEALKKAGLSSKVSLQ